MAEDPEDSEDLHCLSEGQMDTQRLPPLAQRACVASTQEQLGNSFRGAEGAALQNWSDNEFGKLGKRSCGRVSAVASYAASVFWPQSRTASTETNGMRQSLRVPPKCCGGNTTLIGKETWGSGAEAEHLASRSCLQKRRFDVRNNLCGLCL